jgi:uncharacterized membrane protein YbhN (UPF0104 family)
VAEVVGRDEGRALSEPLPPEAANPRRRALGWLLHALGIALLAVVLWRVPWNDRLFLADGSDLRGTIVRSDADGVAFRPVGEEAARAFRPADLKVRERGMPAAEKGVLSLLGLMSAVPTSVVVLYVLLAVVASAWRWRLLLLTQGIPVTPREAVELTFLGNFFNQVVPGGLVGGDVLKAVYAARGREKAAHAVVSVFVDRLLGLAGTVILACVALAPRFDDPRFHGHALVAYGILAGGGIAGGALLSRRVRAALNMETWVPRVPFVGSFLSEVDQAVLSFRERKSVILAGIGISVLIHAGWCGANALLGHMLGVDLELSAWFAVIPPILIVAVVPLLPGGWGLGEASYVFFLGLVGVPPAPALAVSVLGRAIHMVCALPGGFVFLARRR